MPADSFAGEGEAVAEEAAQMPSSTERSNGVVTDESGTERIAVNIPAATARSVTKASTLPPTTRELRRRRRTSISIPTKAPSVASAAETAGSSTLKTVFDNSPSP